MAKTQEFTCQNGELKKISWHQDTLQKTLINFTWLKRNNMADSITANTQLIFQMKQLGKTKGKRSENLKMYPDLIKYSIADKQRMKDS